jgi:hypothetical protein
MFKKWFQKCFEVNSIRMWIFFIYRSSVSCCSPGSGSCKKIYAAPAPAPTQYMHNRPIEFFLRCNYTLCNTVYRENFNSKMLLSFKNNYYRCYRVFRIISLACKQLQHHERCILIGPEFVQCARPAHCLLICDISGQKTTIPENSYITERTGDFFTIKNLVLERKISV